MIELLAKLTAIPSVSRQEGAIADAVSAELAAAGLTVRRVGHNVWCELGDAPRPRLLLNSHLDTVPPGSAWSADPCTPRLEGERLTALGANDAKGCLTAMITAIGSLQRLRATGERLGGTLLLALTAEEEISGNGLGSVLDEIRPIDAAVVGEPTGLVPMIAQRGLLVLRGTARGRSMHPANAVPGRSDNAIVHAARDLLALETFDWGPPHPLLGRCHANVTRIQGGIANNVIPDACEFMLDIRTTPLESHAALSARLQRALTSELRVHSDRLAPIETAADAAIVRAVLQVLPKTTPAGSASMSDMVFLRDIPAVKFGPGDTARSHTPDEYITRSELEAGAAAYEQIVRAYLRLMSQEAHP